jgi:hypothetical protein
LHPLAQPPYVATPEHGHSPALPSFIMVAIWEYVDNA